MTQSAYVFDSDDRARLTAAEALLDGGTLRLLERLGVTTGWRCLEVGAGGSIARWLAETAGPTVCVVATDLDIRQSTLWRSELRLDAE